MVLIKILVLFIFIYFLSISYLSIEKSNKIQIKEHFIDYKTEKNNIQDSKRIIAIGDIHGNLESLVKILYKTKLINKNGNWIPNSNTILVQVGDVVDRGTHSLESIQYLQKIQKQAKNGQVIRLLGNHEIMLLENDYRFINPYTDTDEKLDIIKNILINDIKKGLIKPSFAFGNLLFIHAGISRNFLNKLNLKNITAKNVSNSINNITLNILHKKNYLNEKEVSLHNEPLFGPDGPFWIRTSKTYDEFPYEKFIQIIGHTPNNGINISPKLGAIYIDIGLTENKKIGYLEITNDGFYSYEGNIRNINKKKII